MRHKSIKHIKICKWCVVVLWFLFYVNIWRMALLEWPHQLYFIKIFNYLILMCILFPTVFSVICCCCCFFCFIGKILHDLTKHGNTFLWINNLLMWSLNSNKIWKSIPNLNWRWERENTAKYQLFIWLHTSIGIWWAIHSNSR